MAKRARAIHNRDSAAEDQRVTTLELFFDLVFVFTLTQITALLSASLSWESLFQSVLVFIVLFWMYGGYAWLTNSVPPMTPGRRLLLIAGMAAFLICALAIPNAFQDTGVIFGIGYLVVIIVHGFMYLSALGSWLENLGHCAYELSVRCCRDRFRVCRWTESLPTLASRHCSSCDYFLPRNQTPVPTSGQSFYRATRTLAAGCFG
jgi:hypothetical protein